MSNYNSLLVLLLRELVVRQKSKQEFVAISLHLLLLSHLLAVVFIGERGCRFFQIFLFSARGPQNLIIRKDLQVI